MKRGKIWGVLTWRGKSEINGEELLTFTYVCSLIPRLTGQGELHHLVWCIHACSSCYSSTPAAKGEERVRRVRSPLKKQWKVLPKDF